ncbi:hypothetical protein [Pseudomonas lutea]|uniref:Uncharacterized protein n=1 Tax=Pseudomonas lutea TaxID=243924 RepID=A0A9X0JIA5_9PSED|nr:hypothetical protein [Pseudomonas lutea]KGF63645.1 hypothetical protein LT42_17240 [Pseudomonas lutea]
MNSTIPNLKQLAEEAEFQMAAAKDQLEWFSALARAISRDVEHNAGRDVVVLAHLANYLGDTGAPGTESAIEMFGKIARSESAPQNPDMTNRGAHAEGAPQ